MLKHEALTERIIAAFFQVYNNLGYGFLEKVYRAAMLIELRKRGIYEIPEAKIEVYYDGIFISDYFADLLVEGVVILELKAADAIVAEHEAQLLNYLKASSIDVGLLLNFGPKPQFRRRVFETARLPANPTTVPDPSIPPPSSIP